MRRIVLFLVFFAALASAGGETCWISVPGAGDGTSCFAAVFTNAGAVASARWTTTALGVYEAFVNGRRVGSEILKPGFTHAKKCRRTFTHDVTPLLARAAGDVNRLTAEVSTGWWRDAIMGRPAVPTAFRGRLEVAYADGRTEVLGTNEKTWRGAVGGPVVAAGIYEGETYDARRPFPDRAAMGRVVRTSAFAGELLPNDGASVCLREDLAVRRGPFRLRPGERRVVDFGQNAAAIPRFRFRARRGTVLTALPAEMVNDAEKGVRGCDGPKGSVYRANLRTGDREMRLCYTFAGAPDGETYEPRFTYFGYRYLELSATDEVTVDEVTSVPVSSIAREDETGTLETGDAAVNRLLSNVRWGMLSNYLSVPTDCPQRNERLGWTADTQVFAATGAYLADTAAFLGKWMRDLRDTQSATGAFPVIAPPASFTPAYMRFCWSDAGVIVPWTVWRHFGDAGILRANWRAMVRFVDHVDATRYDREATAGENGGDQYGDWLSFEKYESTSGQAHFRTPGDRHPPARPEAVRYWNYLGACYALLDARLMREMAPAVGADAAKYAAMEMRAKEFLLGAFLPEGRLPALFDGMQTPRLFALRLGLVTGSAKERICRELREIFARRGNTLATGFLGTSILLDALSENGLTDLAYDVLLNHAFPGWLYSVDQGATTVWERWNSYTKKEGFGPVSMNSFNHYAYGCVVGWLYSTAAGMRPDSSAPGFAHFTLAPHPDRRLGHLKASLRTRRGTIESAWRYAPDGTCFWNFTIPEGTSATIRLPNGRTEERSPGRHEIKLAM